MIEHHNPQNAPQLIGKMGAKFVDHVRHYGKNTGTNSEPSSVKKSACSKF